MITETPARIMGINEKGSLQAGKDADILIFTENIDIRMTMIKGKIVYQKSAEGNIGSSQSVITH